ncbi:hypothetical protein K3728_02775 [Rhodobacteraceae bacterium M385]|nr:hypothetical protein K3728_02775 [Rhodobacteraceae bacterium M385]
MPEISNGTILAGIVLGFLLSMTVSRIWGRPLFVPLAILLGVGVAYGIPLAGAFVGSALARVWDVTGLPPLTSGAIFIGLWCALFLVTLLPRGRLGGWRLAAVGTLSFFATAYGVPLILDRVTGTYQAASLRADVTHCTSGMTGQVQPRQATNICDQPIVVGLCLPGEVNPTPCAQSVLLAPGETATLDPGTARLSSVPGNPGGLTVVACRPPDRPSRWGNVTGRGYRGVCLPPR